MELRTLNDWVVVPRLQRTPGRGRSREFRRLGKAVHLETRPSALERYGLKLSDVVDAVRDNNANAGGSVLKRGDMSYVIRGRGLLLNERDIAGTVVDRIGGSPIYLRDVAEIGLDSRLPSGILDSTIGRSRSKASC